MNIIKSSCISPLYSFLLDPLSSDSHPPVRLSARPEQSDITWYFYPFLLTQIFYECCNCLFIFFLALPLALRPYFLVTRSSWSSLPLTGVLPLTWDRDGFPRGEFTLAFKPISFLFSPFFFPPPSLHLSSLQPPAFSALRVLFSFLCSLFRDGRTRPSLPVANHL